MATFDCKVLRLEIEPHPNADRLELAKIGDYRSIVGKGQYKTGDLGVYIPEAALVPAWLLEKMNLTGKLSGKEHNRVKAVKLRGVLSQGLVCGAEFRAPGEAEVKQPGGLLLKAEDGQSLLAAEGEDVRLFLGIEKYEPIVPSCMRGEVHNAFGFTLKYDIENLKKYPDVFVSTETVIFTEKLHGTWTCFGFHPEFEKEPYLVSSKGLSDNGLVLKLNDANARNLYVQMLKHTEDEEGMNIVDRLRQYMLDEKGWVDAPCYVLGETYGPGVQKHFDYGLLKPAFRVFDIYIGTPGHGRYLRPDEMADACDAIGVDSVPLLYWGPYSRGKVEKYTSGSETSSGKEAHIREGIVIRPLIEREVIGPGRLILKSVSEEYLLMKGGTDYT